MEEYYPSEIARLVLGYLNEVECQHSWEIFLQECFDLREYYRLFKQGKVYSTKVNGKSLLEILGEYCSLKYKFSCENDQSKNSSKGYFDHRINNASIEANEENVCRSTVDEMVQTSPVTPACETPKRKSRSRITVLSFDQEARSVNKNKTTNNFSDDELNCSNSGLNYPVEESVFANNNRSSVPEHRDISVQTESSLNTVLPDTLDIGIQTENLCQCSPRFSRNSPQNSHEQFCASQDISSICFTPLLDCNRQNPESSTNHESLENCAISELDEHYTEPTDICDNYINLAEALQTSDRGSSLNIITNKETEKSKNALAESRSKSPEQIKSISKNEDSLFDKKSCISSKSFAVEHQNAATTSISMDDMDCVDDVSHSSPLPVQDKSLDDHVIVKSLLNTKNVDCSSAVNENEGNNLAEENSNCSPCKEIHQNTENQSKPNSESEVINRIPEALDGIPSSVSADFSSSVKKVNCDKIQALQAQDCDKPINSELTLPSCTKSSVKNSSNDAVAIDETCDNLINTSEGSSQNNQDIVVDSEKNNESVDHLVSVHESAAVSVEKNCEDTILKSGQNIANKSETNNITGSDIVAQTNTVENQTSKNVPSNANKFSCNSTVNNSMIPNVQNVTTAQNNGQPYQYLMILPMQTVPTINVVNPLMPQPVTFVSNVSSLNVSSKGNVAVSPKSALQNSSVFINSQTEKTASLPSPVGPITKRNEMQTIITSSPKLAIGFSPLKVQCSPKNKTESVFPTVSPSLKQKKVVSPKTPLSQKKTDNYVSPTVSPALKQKKVESPKTPTSQKKTNDCVSLTVSPTLKQKKIGSPKTPSSQKKNKKTASPYVSPRLKQKRSMSPKEMTPSKKCKMCDSPCKSPALKQSVVSNSPRTLKKAKKSVTPCKSPALKQNKGVSSKAQSPLKTRKDSKKRPQRKTKEKRPAQDSDAYVKQPKKTILKNSKKKQSSTTSHPLSPAKTLSKSTQKKSSLSGSKKPIPKSRPKVDIEAASKSKNKNCSDIKVELIDVRKSSHVRCLNFNTYLTENNSRHDENILEEAPLPDRTSPTNAYGEDNSKNVTKSSDKNFSVLNNQKRISRFGILQSRTKKVTVDKNLKPLSDIITVTCYPKSMKDSSYVQSFKPAVPQVVKDISNKCSTIPQNIELADVSNSEGFNQTLCQTKDSTILSSSEKDGKQFRSTICREISNDENADINSFQHNLVSNEITNCEMGSSEKNLMRNGEPLVTGKTNVDVQEKNNEKNNLKHSAKKTFVCHSPKKKVISYEKPKPSVPNISKLNSNYLDSTDKQVNSGDCCGISQDIEVVELSDDEDTNESTSVLISNTEGTTSVPPCEKDDKQNISSAHSEESNHEIAESNSTNNHFVSYLIGKKLLIDNEKTTSATKNANSSIHSSAEDLSLNPSEQNNEPIIIEKSCIDVEENTNKLNKCFTRNEQIANINSEVLSTVSDDFIYERDDLDCSRSLMINTSPFSEEGDPKSIENSMISSCNENFEDCDSPNFALKPDELNDLSPKENPEDVSSALNTCASNVDSSDKPSNVPTPINEINSLHESSNVLSAQRQARHDVPAPIQNTNSDTDAETLSFEKKIQCTDTKTVRKENLHLPRGLTDSAHFYNPLSKVSKLNKNPSKKNLLNNQHVLANDHSAISLITSNYSDANKSEPALYSNNLEHPVILNHKATSNEKSENCMETHQLNSSTKKEDLKSSFSANKALLNLTDEKTDSYEKTKLSLSTDSACEGNSVTCEETRLFQLNDKSVNITNESTTPFKKRMRHRSYENSLNCIINRLNSHKQSITKTKSLENLNDEEMCVGSDPSSNCAECLTSEGKEKSVEDLISVPNTNPEISSIKCNLKTASLEKLQNAADLDIIDDATGHFEVNTPKKDNPQKLKDQNAISAKKFLLNSDSDSNSLEHLTQNQEESSSLIKSHGMDAKKNSSKRPLVEKKLKTSFKNNDRNKTKASLRKQNLKKHKMKEILTAVSRIESDSSKLEHVKDTLSDKSNFFTKDKCREFTSEEIMIDDNSQQNFDRIPNTSSNADLEDVSIQILGDNLSGKDISSNDIGCKRKSSEYLCSNNQSPYKLLCDKSNENDMPEEEFYKPVRTKKLKLDNCNLASKVTNLEEKSVSIDSVDQSTSNTTLKSLIEDPPFPIASIHNKLVNDLLISNNVKSQDSPVRFISNAKKSMYKSALVKRIEKDSNLPAGVKIPPKWNTSKIINYSDAIGHSVVDSIMNTKKSNVTGKKIRRSRPTLKIASIQSPSKEAISATKSVPQSICLESSASDSLNNSNAICNMPSNDKTHKKISARKPIKKSTKVPKKRTVQSGKKKKKIASQCYSQGVEQPASCESSKTPDQTNKSKTDKNVTILCETTQDIVEADIGRSDEDGSELANAIAGVERELLNLPPNNSQRSPKGKLLSLSPDKMQEFPKGSYGAVLVSGEKPSSSDCEMETAESGNFSKHMTQEEKLSILMAKVKEFGVDALLEKLDVY